MINFSNFVEDFELCEAWNYPQNSLVEKQREFYKNAKYVNKYKKSLKQQDGHQHHPSILPGPSKDGEASEPARKMKYKKKHSLGLKELYEQTCDEKEKARKEREAMIKAKTEERKGAEARRKEIREKGFKKTRSGQPVMKYKIEHLLKTIQAYKD
ncbi:hypothetical protein GIB67_034505 [Kingdonia uniflora]|uniref:Uncharacterized protein n=1 Tax=Kingdonia uniflora TaxID=39325 RepID=A0A7J7PBA9_9MAGN|nr:hypothetical protein GIB67_034505 [Kingdonia uniflora]